MADAIQVFYLEAEELLEAVEAGLLDLFNDLNNKQQVDAIFRALHTLKGSGAMFGFEALAAFTHHCETAFDRVRKGEVPATAALVSAILDARDHMRALIKDPSNAQTAVGDALLAKLNAALGEPSSVQPIATAPAAVSTTTKPEKVVSEFRLRFSLPSDCMANGTNPIGLLNELRDLGECTIAVDASSVPTLDEITPNELYLNWTVLLKTDQGRDAIDDVFIFVMDDMELECETLSETPVFAEVEVPASAPARTENSAPVVEVAKTQEHVRVPAERLDELMDRVGELVIAQSRLSQLASSSADLSLRSVSEDIERLSSSLRDTMMLLRMVPISQLFGRFRRLVHDLSGETGKQIELVTEGETTEVDKTVIERLADPLIHLVRNSIDHGLEPPQEREAAGKNPVGRVTLSAQHAGGEVVITIRDDGRGINRTRVREKAEANGLIQKGQQLSDQELLQMIFQPGFSTAAQITNLSGRGVGMDVVKRSVEDLRGSIDVTSVDGEGSSISLRIPLTLAIIEGLLVRVADSSYVVPLSSVEECLEISVEEDLRSKDRSVLSVRDNLVPFIRLREVFNTGTDPEEFQKVVVISTGNERVGLVVDQIIGDHQTVIKAMSKLQHSASAFSGATILGDGSVALILDINHLIQQGQNDRANARGAH